MCERERGRKRPAFNNNRRHERWYERQEREKEKGCRHATHTHIRDRGIASGVALAPTGADDDEDDDGDSESAVAEKDEDAEGLGKTCCRSLNPLSPDVPPSPPSSLRVSCSAVMMRFHGIMAGKKSPLHAIHRMGEWFVLPDAAVAGVQVSHPVSSEQVRREAAGASTSESRRTNKRQCSCRERHEET